MGDQLAYLMLGGAPVYFILKSGFHKAKPSIFKDAEGPQTVSADLGDEDLIQPLPMQLFDVNQDAYSPEDD